jgi:hypothetical protein
MSILFFEVVHTTRDYEPTIHKILHFPFLYSIESTTMHELSSSKTKQGDHEEITMLSSETYDEDPVEVSERELLFSVSKGATEVTQNSPLRDCPSLGSTTVDLSISSDEITPNHKVRSSVRLASPGGTAKTVSFCPSPPQVREYVRCNTERKQSSSAHNGTPVQFNNLNKKCRMLKKNLDKLNGDDVKSAVPVKGTQRVTRMAKKLGQAFLMVGASALSSPGARTTNIKNWLGAAPIAKLPVSDTMPVKSSDTRPAKFRWTHRRRRQTSRN